MKQQVSRGRTIQKQQTKIKVGELTIGTRVPHEYFIVRGSGESDLGYHPGAYDIALEKAGGVQNYNHISYSSILPKDSVRIPAPPGEYDHGAVLESITAEAGKGQINPKRLTAGIIITKIFKKGELVGGLVAEYNGSGTREEATAFLKKNVQGMIERRYGSNDIAIEDELFIETIEPKSKFACALVLLGFTSYKVPLLESAS